MPDQDPIKYFNSEVKRLNYYNSQFLVDKDFNDEQLYHNQMRRLLNRSLHTWGIVRGLEVSRAADAGKVTVAPGVGIDRLGREIVLAAQSDALGVADAEAGAKLYVTLSYRDVFDPADKDIKATQTDSEYYTRWTERPKVSVSANAPAADSDDLLLAVVTLDNNKAVGGVDRSVRRYAGSRFGSNDDGKEFSLYADTAGAWHFYDGAKGADRLTADANGNLGVGTATPASVLSIGGAGARINSGPKTWDKGDQFIFDSYADQSAGFNRLFDIAAIGNTNGVAGGSSIRLITNPVHSNTGVERVRIDYNGNVGIGTSAPNFALQVGDINNAGSLKLCVAGRGSTGNFRQWTLRTGDGASAAEIHKLRVRDEQANADRVVVDENGNVGIGTANPLGPLSVGDSSVVGSDGYIVIGKKVADGTRHFRLGFDDKFNFTVGDYGNNNSAAAWTSPFAVAWNAPSKSLYISSAGNVGIGTDAPGTSKLKIASGNDLANFRFDSAGAGELLFVGWTSGWNIDAMASGKHLFINRDANESSDVIVGRSGKEVIVKGSTGNLGIGIGTATPGFPLSFANALGDKISLWGQSGNHYGFGIQGALLQIHTDGSAADIAFGYGTSASLTETVRFKGNGNVGIGTKEPISQLHIRKDVSTKLGPVLTLMNGGGGAGSGVAIDFDGYDPVGSLPSARLQSYDDGAFSSHLSFQTKEPGANGNALKERMRITNKGYVGINEATPEVPLHVAGSRSIPLTDSPDGFSNNGGFNNTNNLGTANGGNFNVTILASGWVAGAGIVANSDRRIKEVVGRSDTARDLEIIRRLRAIDYRPLDKAGEGASLRRGFIAQEVLELLPQAVGCRRDFIPDIYSEPAAFAFDRERGKLSVTLHAPHGLAEGESVRVLTERGPKTVAVTAITGPDSFVAGGFAEEPARVFVYGRQVDDFLSVHYEQVFTTAVGALQELKREKDAEVTALREEMDGLKAANGALAERVRLLEGVSAAGAGFAGVAKSLNGNGR